MPCPLLAAALPLIGHEAIRSRSTIGGSLAHADPAAELPAAARVLDAEFVVPRRICWSARGRRRT
jgi:aerobic carbon-monoxide dehydrogenase medium subunit